MTTTKEPTQRMEVLVSMVRALDSGPVEYKPGDFAEFPPKDVANLIAKRIARPIGTAATIGR